MINDGTVHFTCCFNFQESQRKLANVTKHKYNFKTFSRLWTFIAPVVFALFAPNSQITSLYC